MAIITMMTARDSRGPVTGAPPARTIVIVLPRTGLLLDAEMPLMASQDVLDDGEPEAGAAQRGVRAGSTR